ncbi:MAG: hypothetical protein HFJ84_05780 [Clostridiales bacterium]|jgi:hypothetical protein|nr:hypothetical protein [Dorea sp.]MCI9576162.1 hypothetical protein [Clostridiales bacterium]
MINQTPLLLLDNSSMMSVINEGEFKSSHLTFEEAKVILQNYEEADTLRCFHNPDIETIIFQYLGIDHKHFPYKRVRNMRPGQDALIFKLYVSPSASSPIIQVDGTEAKKIQNVYVYCQYLSRLK